MCLGFGCAPPFLAGVLGCVAPRLVCRVTAWNEQKEEEEKDALKRKINAEIVFSELKTPPQIFAPLFGVVSRMFTHTARKENKERPKQDRVKTVRAQNTGKMRTVAIEQGKPINTKKEMKSASKHVCYDTAKYEAAT